MIERIPPNSMDAEKAVLGAVILNNELFHHVAPIIGPDDFYRTGHGLLFTAMTALERSGTPIDIVTLVGKLKQEKELDKVGGASYVSSLTSEVPTLSSAVHYAKQISELARRRTIIDAGHELVDNVYHLPETDSNLAAFDSRIAKTRSSDEGSRKIRLYLSAVAKDVEDLNAGIIVPSIPTGFADLDEKCPICPGDMVLIGGRPGMGKTSLGLNISLNASVAGANSLFVSAEMPAHQVVQRAVSSLGGINTAKFRRGGFVDKDWLGLTRAASKIDGMPMWIYAKGGLTAARVCAEISRMVRKDGIQLVIVDHIHQLAGHGKRLDVIGEAAQMFKACALSNNIAIIVLCQLNRGVESRMPPKPMLADLRETGELEAVADSIWLMYRQDYYEQKGLFTEKAAAKFLRPEFKGSGVVSIDKSRHGPEGYAILHWDGATTSFKNATRANY